MTTSIILLNLLIGTHSFDDNQRSPMLVPWLAKMGDSYGKIQGELQAYWRLEQAQIFCELYPRMKNKPYFESGDLVSVGETEGDEGNYEPDDGTGEESHEAQTPAANEERALLLASE
jgi:hypothetical protein